MKATNLPAFLIFGDTKYHRYLQSAWSKIVFPDFSKIIFSPTFPWPHKIPTFSSFPWPVETLWPALQMLSRSNKHQIKALCVKSQTQNIAKKTAYTNVLTSNTQEIIWQLLRAICALRRAILLHFISCCPYPISFAECIPTDNNRM